MKPTLLKVNASATTFCRPFHHDDLLPTKMTSATFCCLFWLLTKLEDKKGWATFWRPFFIIYLSLIVCEILKIKMLLHSTTTDPFQFGLTDTRNTSHGSDSDENALKEIQFFFPEFDKGVFFDQEVNRWIDAYNNSKFLSVTKPRIKRPKLELDTSAFVHRLPTT